MSNQVDEPGGARTREPQDKSSAPAPSVQTSMRGSLFLRIYATFVISVLSFAALVGVLVFAAASSWSEERVLELVDRAELAGAPLAEATHAHDQAAILQELELLERELDAEVSVFPRGRGRRLDPPIGTDPAAHHPPDPFVGPLDKRQINRLRRGQPLVHRRGLAPPSIALALFEGGFYVPEDLEEPPAHKPGSQGRGSNGHDPQQGRFIAVVVIEPRSSRLLIVLLIGGLLLLVLGGGAWPLARSLTSRLAKLERSTEALARGELSHRALTADNPRDEVDRLAGSFNTMADRLETLVMGQRTLLANVSHELRTPIARTKVLVEILGERLESMRAAQTAGDPVADADIARLERGLDEMNEDLAEVEALIKDLLTSGRLELGRDGMLNLETIELSELCEHAAARFDARVECAPELVLEGDRMLLDRLLKNLLANARRACPEGEVRIRGQREGEDIVLEVEDEGPGIPADKRTQIFEPFTRLDAARARDQGGVGLGLYLCRQIAGAHGGSIHAEARLDGRSGARFVIRLGPCNPTSKPSSSSWSATK